MRNVCEFSAKLAVRLAGRTGRRKSLKLMGVVFDVFSDAKELRRLVKRAEDWERLGTERTCDAMTRDGPQKEKLKRVVSMRMLSSTQSDVLNDLEKQTLLTASHPFLDPKVFDIK